MTTTTSAGFSMGVDKVGPDSSRRRAARGDGRRIPAPTPVFHVRRRLVLRMAVATNGRNKGRRHRDRGLPAGRAPSLNGLPLISRRPRSVGMLHNFHYRQYPWTLVPASRWRTRLEAAARGLRFGSARPEVRVRASEESPPQPGEGAGPRGALRRLERIRVSGAREPRRRPRRDRPRGR